MAILNNSNAISTAGGYDINNSLRIRSSASAYLSRTFSTAQTDARKITISFWMKLGSSIGSGTNQTIITGYNGSSPGASGLGIQSDIITWGFGNNSAGNDARLVATQVFRDPSAWYHIVAVGDSTLATSTDRMKLYVNGVQVTAITTYNAPNLNLSCQVGVNTANNRIGTRWNTGSEYFDGYLSEFYVIDGQALTPSSFGQTDAVTGSWQPKAYTGTYGNNGYYLKFSDIATTSGSNAGLGKDFSGNANYWTTNNISVTAGTTYDAMTDSPTLTSATVANYAVLNPVATTTAGAVINGNLRTNAADKRWYSSLGMSSGKWYFEYTIVSTNLSVGIGNDLNAQGTNLTGMLTYANSGLKYNGASSSSYGASYTANDVIGVALDMDAGTLVFYKNNVSQGTAFTGLTGTYYASCNTGASGATFVNFGQQPFTYTPPTGFNRLNTYNLPDSTIKKGNKYMDATLYTGNGSTQTITNAGAFKPDFVWTKSRNRTTVSDHIWNDSTRPIGANIYSNLTNAEDINATARVTSFNSNGYSIGNGVSLNAAGDTYVGWQWQAGQGTNTTNTSGSITSTVSANPTAGFSVVTWTGNGTVGATVGHSLGVAPKMVIMKRRNGATNWQVWITGFNATTFLFLQSTNAVSTGENYFNSTLPSSTLLTLSANSEVNASGGTYVAYCWAAIPGFSAFGSYTGNGSTNGPFVYTGFRPKFVLIKNTSSAFGWHILDTSRNTYNLATNQLFPNTNAAEGTGAWFHADLLSNGFKLRLSASESNANVSNYIYMAFAENPTKYALAR